MDKKIIYISGKITGTSDFVERFASAEDSIKRLLPGADVINPVKICSHIKDGSAWSEYMKVCLQALKGCTHIKMMKGWQDSKGACVEKIMAEEYGLIFI